MLLLTVRLLISRLVGQDFAIGIFLVAAGLVFLLMGLRISRPLLVTSFAGIGFVVGSHLPVFANTPWVGGLAIAFALGLISVCIMKLSVAVLAGSWAAVVIMVMLQGHGASDEIGLAAAAIVLLIVVSLTFVMYEHVIAFVTSFEGALLILGGLIVFLSQTPTLWWYVKNVLLDTAVFLPFMIFSATVMGIYFQLAGEQQRQMTGN